MLDLTQAITKLEQLGAAAAENVQKNTLKLEELSIGHDERRYVLKLGNEYAIRDIPYYAPARNHTVKDLASLIAIAVKAPSPVIWHNRDQVVLVWDDARRDEWVRFPLTQTSAFAAVRENGGKKYQQREFVRLLRVTLAGKIREAAVLIPSVKSLKFNQRSEAHSDLQHGDESLGRTVLAQVIGSEAIPEAATLALEVYREFSSPTIVNCLVEIDVEKQQLALTPLGDEVEDAIRQAQLDLHDLIVEKLEAEQLGKTVDVPVYFGTV